MTMRLDRRWLAGLFCLIAAPCVVVGLGWVRADVAETPAAEEPAAEPDPFAVPGGTIDELFQFVLGLRGVQPKSFDAAGIAEFQSNVGNALVGVSDKILAADPTDEQAANAVGLKIQGLSLLKYAGEKGIIARIEGLPEELEKAGFGAHVRPAKAFVLESKFWETNDLSDEEVNENVAKVKAFLSAGPMDDVARSLAMAAAQAAENGGNTDLAARLFREFGQMLADSDDESAQSTGEIMQGAARRVKLVGNKMSLEGTMVNGEPLDWASYEGKVVLVDFWATWCGPCLAEIPNIRENYELYHDRGFEVVGVSTDRDRAALDGFLEKNDLPWTIVFDHAMDDTDSPRMGVHYGVFGIPTVILVAADGNVVSLNARGPELGRLLGELIGPPVDDGDDDDDDDDE